MTEEEQDEILQELVRVVRTISDSLKLTTEITFYLGKRVTRLEKGDFGAITITPEEEQMLEILHSVKAFPDTTSI